MEERRQLAAKRPARRSAAGDYAAAHDRGGALDLATVLAGRSTTATRRRGRTTPARRATRRRRRGLRTGAAGNARGDGGDGERPGGGRAGHGPALTRREREIAVLVASGLSNREIAARLFISKRTVDAHVEHIFGKLEISSRVQLTMWLQSQARIGA